MKNQTSDYRCGFFRVYHSNLPLFVSKRATGMIILLKSTTVALFLSFLHLRRWGAREISFPEDRSQLSFHLQQLPLLPTPVL